MTFPLNFWDISLFLAAIAVISLITSEILSMSYGKINIRVDRKKLKNISYTILILFVVTVVIRILAIIFSF